jgi:hypothetical protein
MTMTTNSHQAWTDEGGHVKKEQRGRSRCQRPAPITGPLGADG